MDNRPTYISAESKHFQCRYCGAIVRPGQGGIPSERPEGIDAMFCPKCIAKRNLAGESAQKLKDAPDSEISHSSGERLTRLNQELALQRQELLLIRGELSALRVAQAEAAKAQYEVLVKLLEKVGGQEVGLPPVSDSRTEP